MSDNIIKTILKKIYNLAYIVLPSQDEAKLANDAEKYWQESDISKKKQDFSHWCGIGRWDEKNWHKIGESHFNMFNKICAIDGAKKENFNTMIEWGQGGGANAVHFAKVFSKIYAVDISEPNLEECKKQMLKINYNGFNPILIPAEKPESCIDKIITLCDFFLSTAVFQHFPSKNYGIKILHIANKILRNEGLGIIQIRYDNANQQYFAKKRDYRLNAITFTSYNIDEFWDMLKETGFSPLGITLDTSVNYAYYFVKKLNPTKN